MPFLEMIGLPESIVGLLRESSSGYALTAYAMYKVISLRKMNITVIRTENLFWDFTSDASHCSFPDCNPCQVHRDSGRHVAVGAVPAQARLPVHTTASQGLHSGQNGGDKGETHREDGGDEGEIFGENGGD